GGPACGNELVNPGGELLCFEHGIADRGYCLCRRRDRCLCPERPGQTAQSDTHADDQPQPRVLEHRSLPSTSDGTREVVTSAQGKGYASTGAAKASVCIIKHSRVEI